MRCEYSLTTAIRFIRTLKLSQSFPKFSSLKSGKRTKVSTLCRSRKSLYFQPHSP